MSAASDETLFTRMSSEKTDNPSLGALSRKQSMSDVLQKGKFDHSSRKGRAGCPLGSKKSSASAPRTTMGKRELRV